MNEKVKPDIDFGDQPVDYSPLIFAMLPPPVEKDLQMFNTYFEKDSSSTVLRDYEIKSMNCKLRAYVLIWMNMNFSTPQFNQLSPIDVFKYFMLEDLSYMRMKKSENGKLIDMIGKSVKVMEVTQMEVEKKRRLI